MAIDDETGPPTREEHEEMQLRKGIAKAIHDAAMEEQERMKDPAYRLRREIEEAERSRAVLYRLAMEQSVPFELRYVKYKG